MSAGARLLALVAAMLAAFALKGALVAPPATVESAFDGGRALERLGRILGDGQPHPVDSDASDAVRARLLSELAAIGLRGVMRNAVNCSAMPDSRVVSCARVRNVVATVPGIRDGRDLLLNSHYDSTPAGPGASDDGLGVAVMLEVAAQLRANPPPRPVTLLFNEGEEYGLNGAAAFIANDPLARQVDSLINIEARGVSGPALMFETSEPNAAAIRLFASAARRPAANSLSTDFAKLIPNSTDVVKFAPRGWTLLNFAIIGNETRYHTPGDTLAALDRRSLAHMGSEVLAATQAMASAQAPAKAGSGRVVFTDIAGLTLVVLPLAVAATLLGLLLLAALVLGWRRRALGRPLLLAAAMVAGGLATAWVLGFIGGLVRAGDFWRAYPLVTYLAIYAGILTAMAAIWVRWGAGRERTAMRAASWVLILLVGAALSLAVPGASIVFLAGPAVALAGIALAKRSPSASTVLLWIAALVQLFQFAQLLALIEMLLVDGPLWAVAPLAALAALPILVEIRPARGLAVPLLAGLSTALALAAMLLPRASAERPGAFTIDYVRDDSRGEAHWAIASKQAPLPAALRDGSWRTGTLPYNGRTRWIRRAPRLEVPTARARVIDMMPAGRGRRVRLLLSLGGANAIAVRFAEDAAVVALGRPAGPVRISKSGEPSQASLRCSGRACEGLTVDILLADRKPVAAELIASRFALPPQGERILAARPADAHAQYGTDSSVRIRRVRF